MKVSAFFTVSRDGHPIELEISGQVFGPEPDIGIFGYAAESIDNDEGLVLTDKEESEAALILSAKAETLEGDNDF